MRAIGIARMWSKVSHADCRRLVSPSYGRRIKLALDRARPISKLRKIPDDLPLDEFDRRVLDAWRDDLLAEEDDGPEADEADDAEAPAIAPVAANDAGVEGSEALVREKTGLGGEAN